MTTGAELIARILRPMRDTAQDFFPDAELLDYINEAADDLALREQLIRETQDFITADGVIDYTAQPQLAQIRWAKSPDGMEVAWMDESTFFDYAATYPSWTMGSPLATTFDQKIYIHPTPADGETWSVGYYGLPTPLASDTDVLGLSRQWETKIVAYGKRECYYRLGEIGLGDREAQKYDSGLRPSAIVTDRNMPGSVNLAREPNIFDSDIDAIHLGG